jgi:photosystem II stability/assembly factor-like uncharacterized protein
MNRRSVRTWVAGLGALVFALCAPAARGGHYTWTTSGAEPGLVFQAVIDPGVSSRLYVVDSVFGAYPFRSTDGGQNWSYLESLGCCVPYFVADSSTPGTLYVPGYPTVRKTVDGGETWFPAGQGLFGAVSSLVLSPSSPSTLYAIAGSSPARLFRSDDGGLLWDEVVGNFPPTGYYRLSADAFQSQTLYLLVDLAPLWKSVDGGVTWNPAGTGLPQSANKVFSDPRTPGVVFATTGDAGIFKSTDSGATFVPANAGIAGHDARDIAFDPSNPSKLWAGTFGPSSDVNVSGGLFVSVDGGSSWSPVDVGIFGRHYASAVAVDAANPSHLLVGAGTSALLGRLLLSVDGGSSWTPVEKGLSGYPSNAAVGDAALADRAFGLSGSRFYRTTDRGASWSLLSTQTYGMVSLIQDANSTDTLYAQYNGYADNTQYGGVYKTENGGTSWTDSSSGLLATAMHRLALGRSDSNVLLASTDGGIFLSPDAAASWSSVLPGLGKAVAVDPGDAGILYAAVADSGLGSFQRSDDGGATWNLASGAPSRWAADVAIPASDPSSVYALYPNNHVYKSSDRGLSFSDSSQGLPGFDATELGVLAVDPSDAATVYAAAGLGGAVYRTRDSGGTWAPLPAAIPMLTNLAFSVSATGRTLYASGIAGIFQLDRSFVDVPDADPFWGAVDAAAMNGLSAGCGAGRYCPASIVTRAQIAVFLERAKHGVTFVPPPATGLVFNDVPGSSFAAAWIEALWPDGITSGCGAGNYCPTAELSRAEMAVMVLKALHGGDYAPPPATGTVFTDVPADAFAAAWIEELYNEGIGAGCGGGSFCPDASLTRAQAAALLKHAFQLP